MPPIKGDRLYVTLGASQVRRRLKGRGYGVRKVESAGSNRALIIHTATGQHRRELHSLFADVIESDSGEADADRSDEPSGQRPPGGDPPDR